jgi:hypothetical protein
MILSKVLLHLSFIALSMGSEKGLDFKNGEKKVKSNGIIVVVS